LVTRYAHALGFLVKVGDKIARGDAIAQVGSSGRSTGPHVHVEVLKNGRAVNPAGYLRAGR
jgi:murein DD-endopeptidase MepM/ murein hydrolase activator NlpD